MAPLRLPPPRLGQTASQFGEQVSLPRLVRRDQLLRGNSAIEGSRSVAQMGGPALGGALSSLLSAPFAALSSALFFVASGTSIAAIRHRVRPCW